MLPKIKSGPNRAYINGLRPEIVLAFTVACFVYQHYGQTYCTITEGLGAAHKHGSLHFTGNAIDLRLPTSKKIEIVANLGDSLGEDYDVVLKKDHIHIEFQPKVGINQ